MSDVSKNIEINEPLTRKAVEKESANKTTHRINFRIEKILYKRAIDLLPIGVPVSEKCRQLLLDWIIEQNTVREQWSERKTNEDDKNAKDTKTR